MNTLWAGGVNNQMDSIEQISYLLFLRLLSEKDEQLAAIDKNYKRVFSGEWARFAWGNFVTLTGDQLFDAVRDAIESLHKLPGMTETGKLLFSRATLKIYDRPTLRAVLQGLHTLDLAAHEGHDLKGDMYEYLLSQLAASGTNGQFRTPRHINEGGSGVGSTQYSFDSGTTWLTYEEPFTVSGEGETAISYRSVDNLGNVEGVRTLTIRIDTTPPSTPSQPSYTSTASSVTLTWPAATDAGSSMAYYTVYRNGTAVGTTSSLTYTDTGLTPSTTFSPLYASPFFSVS